MKILLADDHVLFLEGLKNLLAAYDLQVIGTASDGREAVAQALALHPDLVLMDISMPHCNGLAATRQIKAQRPEIQVVMLTTSAEDQDLFESIKSGACGYLLKNSSGEAFIEALHGLEQGVPPFSPGLAARLLQEFARRSAPPAPEKPPASPDQVQTGLSERQVEVLKLVASGLTYKEAGLRLALSERTVRYHMTEIMHRLHLEHRSQVLAYAGQLGLGCPEED